MVYEMLLTGKENALTSKDLCGRLNINRRELTSAIERERRQGHPICASTGEFSGYFIPANRREMEQYCESLGQRANEILKTRAACLRSLNQLSV